MRSLGQPAEHNSYHGNEEPCFSILGFNLIVANQPTMLHKPAKGPFDNPAFEQNVEPALTFWPCDDPQAQRACFAMLGHPSGEIGAPIALVGKEATQPTKTSQCLAQKTPRSFPLGHIGRSHAHCQQQPQSVYQDRALDPLGFLGGIVASLPGLVRRSDGLAVQDSGRRLDPFASLHSNLTAQEIVNQWPAAQAPPIAEIPINGLPRAKILGQKTPSTPRTDLVKQGVAEPTHIGGWSAPAFRCFRRGQEQPQQ